MSVASGRVGISLKTKKKGVSGSYLNEVATLGVKFKKYPENLNKTKNQDKYPGGLFYGIYKNHKPKRSLNFFSITTAHVTKNTR